MAYDVFACADCHRPVIPSFGNYDRETLAFQLDQADAAKVRFRHRKHDTAPAAEPLGEGDASVGDTVRDEAGEQCIVTLVDDGKLLGVRVSALAQQSWQVLRAIIDSERPQPVAWLARDMGGNRQNVQRIVNDLQKMQLVTLEENPHHRRASLVVLTDKGRRTYDEAGRLRAPWANGLSEDLKIKDIETTRRVVAELLNKLVELNGEQVST